jgi:hypothetical protein
VNAMADGRVREALKGNIDRGTWISLG